MECKLIRHEITGWRNIPLYDEIKIINGSIVNGNKIGEYQIIESDNEVKEGMFTAIMAPDDAMNANDSKRAPKSSLVLIDLEAHVEEGELGVFFYNGICIIRILKSQGKYPVLTAHNKTYSDIQVIKDDEFYVIGRVAEVSMKV